MEYRSWQHMLDRCYNPKHPAFSHYGGRGIVVCDKWLESFDAFLADMGDRPEGKTLDRYPNVNGNYEPGNCRWATDAEQNRNKTNGTKIEFRGEVKSVTEWSETLGIPRMIIFGRLRANWTVDETLTRPVRLRRWAKRPAETTAV